VLAASGHLAFAGIATVTVLGVHLLGRPLGRLIDHDSLVEEDEDLRPYRLHITCKPKSEPHVRALIVQNTGGSDVILRGMETTRGEEGTGRGSAPRCCSTGTRRPGWRTSSPGSRSSPESRPCTGIRPSRSRCPRSAWATTMTTDGD
jgi:hypothetical protein